jgi:nitrite reductase/ring-hydroxylating ferredoxin subunit
VSEIRVAALKDVTPGQPYPVEVEGTPLMLVRIGDEIHALSAECSHQAGPLGEGMVSGTRVVCPWHGWRFDVRTGECLFPTRGGAVPSYPVRIDGDQILVELG